MAFGTLATLAIAAGVVGTAAGIATPIAGASARKKEAAAKEAQANSMAAMYGGSSAASKPMTRAQMLAGNPSILSTPSSNGALSGRGRLLGN